MIALLSVKSLLWNDRKAHLFPDSISRVGFSLIQHFEGLELEAYRDIAGIWTIGYGTTKGVFPGMKIDLSTALKWLARDIRFHSNFVRKCVEVELNQAQYDAMVSWTYNLGPGNLKTSTLLTVLNTGKYDQVPDQIRRWVYAKGKIYPGLVRRREAEANLFAGNLQRVGEIVK